MILVVVRYRDDAERKRLEYLLDKYRGQISVARPQGAVLLLDGDRERLESFLQELASRLSPESIEVYEARPTSLVPEPGSRALTVETGMSCGEASGAITYLMARLRGVLRSSVGSSREYILRGRWGWARVRVVLAPRESGGCRVGVMVEAYEPGLSRIVKTLRRELSVLGGVRAD